MKAIIFHGTDCDPSQFWYNWLKQELEGAGYTVELPHYPEINREPLEQFLPKALKNHTFNGETVLVGHSAGVPLILSILERTDTRIAQAVLVAGFSQQLPGGDADPILQASYDWDKIKANAGDFLIINSVNDPWGCDDKQGRIMFDKLGGTQIIRNDGHFGSRSRNQPFPTFPLLKALILGAKE